MLFDDGRLGYSHLHSLLQDGKTALGVSLSGEKNSISPKIHIISYGKEKLEDSSQYQNGEVASMKSKEELQQEIASNQEKLATAQQAESDAQQARSASQQALNTAKTTQAVAKKNYLFIKRHWLIFKQLRLRVRQTMKKKYDKLQRQKKPSTNKRSIGNNQ